MYRIAICDDDLKYAEYLKKIIEEITNCSSDFIVYKYCSGEEFLRNLHLEFNLAIIDMQMNKVDGITAASHFREHDQNAILVFCTGVQLPKPEFFDVQPYRYLMKSYSDAKITNELRLVVEKMQEIKRKSYFVVFSDGEAKKILIDDIMYVSNLKRGCCIHLFSRKNKQRYELVSNKKLADAYIELEKHYFEYAHNSYIVNLKMIIAVKKDIITLEDSTTLNISRSKKEVFHSRFARYLGGKYRRNRYQYGENG